MGPTGAGGTGAAFGPGTFCGVTVLSADVDGTSSRACRTAVFVGLSDVVTRESRTITLPRVQTSLTTIAG
jgi:hypothetical protein